LRAGLLPAAVLGTGATPGSELGMELELSLGRGRWLALGGSLRGAVEVVTGSSVRSFTAQQMTLLVWRDLGLGGLGGGLSVAASYRHFPGAGEGMDSGWVPMAGLGLRRDLALGPGLVVSPRLALQADLRRTEISYGGQTEGTLQPLWASLGLGLGWTSAGSGL